jgi:hypothetical protein
MFAAASQREEGREMSEEVEEEMCVKREVA